MKRFKLTLAAMASAAAAAFGAATPAHSQVDPYIGQITQFGFDFCPSGWAPANGQVIPVSSNPALYSLYGPTYGGDGRTSFALPNLNGRHAAGVGIGAGLPPLNPGQVIGSETVSLTLSQMPEHTHSFHASSQGPDSATPAGSGFATYPPASVAYAAAGTSDVIMNPGLVQTVGAGAPFSVRQPYLALTWCVALQGVYPTRP